MDVETEAPPPREFATVLLEHAKGRSHDELSKGLAQVARAVLDTGKPGAVTLSLKIEPAKGIEGLVSIEDKITIKAPTFDRPKTAYFVSEAGGLSVHHPQQLMFPVQSGSGDTR